MKILVVTLHYLRGSGGGVFASRAYINSLAEIAEEITLLYPYKKEEEAEGIDGRVILCPVENNLPKVKKIYQAITGQNNRFKKVFEPLLAEKKYDLVVFDNSRCSHGLIEIAHNYGIKCITIHHNCEFEYVRDNVGSLMKPLSVYWAKQIEKEALTKSDLNLVLTEQDKNLFVSYYKAESNKIRVIGCFEFKPSKVIDIDRDLQCEKFVITGNLSTMQTQVSLNRWIKQYYPVLKNEYPDCSLTVAGKNPSLELKKLCSKNSIILTPSPKDMQAVLLDKDIYICPTELGGGLKLRVMDGLKTGLPVVSHIVSTRGYETFVDKGILFPYSDVSSFVDALKKVRNLEMKRSEIQKIYTEVFSFENGKKRMKEEVESLFK